LRASRISAKPQRKRRSGPQIAIRFLILCVVIGILAVAGAFVIRSVSQHGTSTSITVDLTVNPSLNPVEAAALGGYLSINQDALNTPYGTSETFIPFEVAPGQNASQIGDQLVSLGLIGDATLFRNYLRYYGLDRQLEAGTYDLAATMTIPEIALALTDATPDEITVRITEGWRREQIAESIDQQADVPFTGADFLAATGAAVPLPPDSSLSTAIPQDATLEGFLFPDTYRIAVDAAATDLTEKLLLNFQSRVTPQMRADATERGMTLFDVVTLASIVEREAVVAEERPIIASVYLNRLAAGTKLEADPTVQYAMGYQVDTGQWWNLNLTQEDYLRVESPYNTYLYPDLPPGPISNPGLDSIRAVIYPANTPYFFFRAACDGSGRHLFAVTYEEHLNNACP
jgi:UPF0755 protein